MRRVLHILTRPNDALPRELIALQKAAGGAEIEVIDLTAPEPDYQALLEKIFEADSIESW
ncbi:MAG TPA: hypothetical protein VGO59_10240 [Verrucomicrobiae bacterium]|jgi:hypothetical protein